MEDGALREEVYNHGMALNPQNDRVQCNYCGLVVAGFEYLQLHLGGIRGKTPECQDVPSNVKGLFRGGLDPVEERNLRQKAGNLHKTGCPTDTITNSKGENRKRGKAESAENDGPKDSKRVSFDSITVSRNSSIALASNLHDKSASKKKISSRQDCQSSSVTVKRWIGRFLIENGIDFEAVKSYSFRKMMEVMSNASDITSHMPSVQDLKGWILSDELKEIKSYVEEVRNSWSRTGCSIVLDGWVDDRGRNLLVVVADCPLGAIYIQSFDISTLVEDVDGMLLLLDGVLAEVGVQNVVQIIAHTASKFMNDVGQRLMEKYRTLFWTVSASHCVALMLEKIGLLNSVKQVLDKAKTITKFFYSHAEALKLMRRHTRSLDLVKPSKIKSAMPFLTLENMLMEKTNLQNMVSSLEWTNSPWPSSTEGKRVASLLYDKSFWVRISSVVRATIPLVRVLSLINGDGDPHVGFIYETMDQVKETIAEELGWKKTQYMPYWDIIDDKWNNILHSPLHAAGYFLNPRFLYDEDFCADSEVAGGLLVAIVRLVEDKHTQDLITKQLDVYRGCQGTFKRGTENDKQNSIPPAAWWSSFGSHCPDLQKLAIRILSQSCNGAESYGLKKDVAEKLQSSSGRNSAEQQQLINLAFIHHNMNLKQKMGARCDTDAGEIDSLSDWIMDELAQSKDAMHKKGNASCLNHMYGGTNFKRNAGVQQGPSDIKKAEL